MNMEQLMNVLSGGDEEDQPIPPTLSLGEHVETLRRVAGYLLEPATEFRPGDILVHKFPEESIFRFGDQPIIYLGKVDFDPLTSATVLVDDLANAGIAEVRNMRFGYLDKGRFFVGMSSSSHFRLHPDFPRAG